MPQTCNNTLQGDYRNLDNCEKYPLCLDIIRNRVKPERDKIVPTNSMAQQRRDLWWKFTGPTVELYNAIKSLDLVIVNSAVSKHHIMAFLPSNFVYSNALNVFAFQTKEYFSILQSNLHEGWAREHGSSLETRPRYNVTDCFETFPFPNGFDNLEQIGEIYHETRRQIMLARQEGLTKIYNRSHDPFESASDIAGLRRLHIEMDNAVAAAYGWNDLELGHDFHETAQGTRYTISESARREVLSRLLQLNHERYEEEVQAGLHDKKKKGKARRKKKEVKKAKRPAKPKIQPELFSAIDAAMEETVDVPAEAAGPTPADQIGAWDQCVCLGCGRHLVGFSVAEHTEKVHGGVRPGYRKVGG